MAAGFPIELDVRLLSDGNLVVFHDKIAERLTGEAKRIDSYTAESLKLLRLLDGPEHVPLFTDVLDLVSGKVGLLIEIKNESFAAGKLEAAVLKALETYRGEYALQSFNALTVRYFKRNAPNAVLGQLAGISPEIAAPPSIQYFMRRILPRLSARVDFVAYELDAMPNDTTRYLKALKMPVIAWTVKTADDLLLARQHADNFIFENVVPDHGWSQPSNG